MLILSRRQAECICLGDDIVLTIVSVGNDKVRIGVKAPPGVRILRTELEVETPTISFPTAASESPSDSEATSEQPNTSIRRAA